LNSHMPSSAGARPASVMTTIKNRIARFNMLISHAGQA
jgi:hypothetical protein